MPLCRSDDPITVSAAPEQRQELRTITEGQLPIWARTSLADAGIRPTTTDADIFYWYLPDDIRALIALEP